MPEPRFHVRTIPRFKKDRNAPRYGKMSIQLPAHDADIELFLPNGQRISVQYRVESPSIDICLPFNTSVNNWKGTDLKDAPAVHGQKHVRLAGQLCIDLPEQILDHEAGPVEGSFESADTK
jgi:hypothetical protein